MAYTTINKSTDYFNTKLYTGNGGTQSITGVGFQPDWTWLKRRNGVGSHRLFDAVRGATKEIFADADLAESTDAESLKSFDSDGFTLGTGGATNGSGNTYANWNWKANGVGSANTAGSINSTVSVNTTAGFSIVKWTGTGSASTVGHGLGVAPKMIIMKRTSGAVNDWVVYHASVGNNKALFLNAVNAPDTDSAYFNDTSPTSLVFSVKSGQTNNNGDNQIAYCFAEKQGYSKFGSYTGNGNADGTFVYTGFKPAFVIIKRTNSTGNWLMLDNKRAGYNQSNYWLEADTSDAEGTTANWIDIFSNGFKLNLSGSAGNGDGNSYIYMAFAEAPLVGSNNVPCTAR